jgi:hypothetical protein
LKTSDVVEALATLHYIPISAYVEHSGTTAATENLRDTVEGWNRRISVNGSGGHEHMVGRDQQQPDRLAVSPWPYRSVCETDQMEDGCR